MPVRPGMFHIADDDGERSALSKHGKAFFAAGGEGDVEAPMQLSPKTEEDVPLVVDDQDAAFRRIGGFRGHGHASCKSAWRAGWAPDVSE